MDIIYPIEKPLIEIKTNRIQTFKVHSYQKIEQIRTFGIFNDTENL